MNRKLFRLMFPVLLLISMLAASLAGGVSQVRAQSSRSWSDPINLSNSGATSNPEIIVDQLGVMHALWVDQYEGYMYTQSTDGIEWTASQKVSYPFDKNLPPLLVPAPDGFIHVFWLSIEKNLEYAQSHSELIGEPAANWAFRTQVSKTVLTFDAAVDPQGVLHLAYIRNVNSDLGPAGVYYVQSIDNGRTWSNEKLLYESQYFRATKAEAAHIRVVVPDEAGDGKVIIAWDNTSLKRMFMSASADSGKSWAEPMQLKGPEDTGGYDMPYNVEMSILGEKTLLMWQVGEPGANQCTLYGEWSDDGGTTWGTPVAILGNQSICPLKLEFLTQKYDSLIALLYYQGNPSLVAWNGTEWSEPQIQDELSFFSNPATRETIVLGSHYGLVKGDQLFLVGSDQGSGGDVWLTSRPIGSITDWTFSESLWSLPVPLTTTSQRIPYMTYAADEEYLHALWSQSPRSAEGNLDETIYYSRWNGVEWTPAREVIVGLTGTAGELSAASNGLGRLFVVWSDEKNGNLLFSWANSGKANSATEWAAPRALPSQSQWTSAPDILIDTSGRIAVVYAVPLNEGRGIYLVQSVDNGVTWSDPVTVFDAVTAGWVMVSQPKIALSGDGRLHVLFTNYSGINGQPADMYYSQSSDGGTSWSAPEVVSESSVVWSDIVTPDDKTIHRMWQQVNNGVVATMHQMSTDSGLNWGKAVEITGVSNIALPVTLASNKTGNLHFIQLVQENIPSYIQEYQLEVQDWMWNGGTWERQPSQEITIKGDKAQYSVAAGISSKGFLNVALVVEYYDLEGELITEIYNIGRSLKDFDVERTPFPAYITEAVTAVSVSTEPVGVQPNPSPIPTSLPDLTGGSSSALSKNLVGISLVLLVLGLTIFIFVRRVKRSGEG